MVVPTIVIINLKLNTIYFFSNVNKISFLNLKIYPSSEWNWLANSNIYLYWYLVHLHQFFSSITSGSTSAWLHFKSEKLNNNYIICNLHII